jgi:hypothetical protein
MSTILVALALVATVAAASTVGVSATRRADRPLRDEPRGAGAPIVIHLPPGARMRLVREKGLSYALEVDDTVRISGINVSQMARVAASLVDARRQAAALDADSTSGA